MRPILFVVLSLTLCCAGAISRDGGDNGRDGDGDGDTESDGDANGDGDGDGDADSDASADADSDGEADGDVDELPECSTDSPEAFMACVERD